MLKLLGLDPPFRICTCRILAKLIFELTRTAEDENIIDKELISLFYEGYKTSILRLNAHLKNSIVAEFLLEHFECEWNLIRYFYC